ncbi:leishmanolysin family protein (macronuclear) [Tetrahymena thermophila SB210]|uniref:Leishmanolysin family protein n=1 Tax=Tetrahymena thermophila (strain SB210) TaxID=312017 RepID=Q22BY2_TETTS|nr:leishmanolysin family protein [Tetrahymena thermophila SB210]EAR82776.1 leishmanolysin family protein [Tetrahymena thermophila SB210]|eukprot:XP_001030439.1 leishmanolysin family protein [Tetrahymena thermophila SB210]
MNKITILILLTISLVNTQQEDQLPVNTYLDDEIDIDEILPKDYFETFEEKYGHRKLQNLEPQPIRITLDFEELDNPQNGDGVTPNIKEYIQKIMYAAQTYLNKLIKVYPRQKPNKHAWNSDKCYDVKLNNQIKTVGIDNSDLHIIVTYQNQKNITQLANAIWCSLDPQPNIGRVKFNIGTMDINESSTQSFQNNFSTALHEILHILGFSQGGFHCWIDPDTGSPYGWQNKFKMHKIERRWQTDNVTKIFTKNLLKTARNYYNCPSIDGMYLENQGGSGSKGSHWERDLVNNEFMTASIVYNTYTISEFTAALLLDTGFYAEINTNLLMPIYWGKNKGCDFFNNSCNTGKYFPEFPDDSEKESCDFFSQGIGQLQNYDYFSQCKTISSYSNSRCQSDSFKPNEKLRQNTGEGSRCFRSNANIKGLDVLDMNGRCFKAQCADDLSSIKVNIWGDEYVTCQYPNQVINLADQTKTTQGTMRCPHDFDLFCNFPKSCPNNCSNNGVCNNGYCMCLKGYAGIDCSKRCGEGQVWDGARCVYNCPSGQFKNFDNTCKSTCPYKQYGDKSTGNCTLCSSNCSSCYGPSPNECLSCKEGYSLQRNQCVDLTCHPSCQQCSGPYSNQCTSCSAGYYLDSRKTCQPCQHPCENCYNSASECTSCGEGYEMDKFSGKCVSIYTCDSSCLECSAYRDPTKCTSCRDGFFLNDYGRCQKCDESCATCSERENKCIKCSDGWEYDAYYQRCIMNCHKSCDTCTVRDDPTACKRCAFNYIMQNKLCVKCDKSCYGCKDDPKKCHYCADGYKFDSNNQTCIPKCRTDEFEDRTGNCQKCKSPCATCKYYQEHCTSCLAGYTYNPQYKSCQVTRNACHESCAQCNRYDDPNSCTLCSKGKYLQSGRCLSCSDKCQSCEGDANVCTSCKKNEFLQNNECIKCHSSCLTCSGISTNCTSCETGFSKDPMTGVCVDSTPVCKSDEYLDRYNKCQKCYSPCSSCFFYPNRCTSCISGYKFNSQTFSCEYDYPTCKDGQYLDANNNCQLCDSSCATCIQTSTRCNSCKSGFVLSRYTCLPSSCQDGFFMNQQGRCLQCSESCTKCVNNQDNCIECARGYTLDKATQKCIRRQKKQQCHPSCKNCSSPNNDSACLSCKDGHYLNNRSQCLQCDNSCLTCDRYSDYCTSCQQGFSLDKIQGKCIPTCRADQFLDVYDNQCKSCEHPCQSCQYYANSCLSCISGYEYDNQRQSCSISCQPGQYVDRDEKCQPCSSPCATCEYYDNRCLSCVSGYTYNNFYCQKSSNNNSRGCHQSCNTCTRAMDPRSCDSCREGYKLVNGSCLKKRGNYSGPNN